MKTLLFILFSFLVSVSSYSQKIFGKDTLKASSGDVIITFIGHGSLLLQWGEQNIYIDPSSRKADLYKFPKADMLFVTHHHNDHCDPAALKALTNDGTKTFMSEIAHEKWNQGMVLYPEQQLSIDAVGITVLPAYNLVHKNEEGQPYHKKGQCNSYILTLGDLRIFIGGDTENTPEMKALKNIDAAFLPMKLPYTMNPAMVVDAVKGFKPNILYPYHYDRKMLPELTELMKQVPEVELRIRKN
ncbi:MAG: MBL fold metallo-hydrolase [Cyclobacteriaceae bacterium]|nr:MBL fold metallo-hydrolase [Cyclobacteriaceae bacterium]